MHNCNQTNNFFLAFNNDNKEIDRGLIYLPTTKRLSPLISALETKKFLLQ